MEIYTIDRFEDGSAYCEGEDGRLIRVPRDTLPAEAREGDVLTLSDGIWAVDVELTARRREEARRMLQKLFRRDTN